MRESPHDGYIWSGQEAADGRSADDLEALIAALNAMKAAFLQAAIRDRNAGEPDGITQRPDGKYETRQTTWELWDTYEAAVAAMQRTP